MQARTVFHVFALACALTNLPQQEVSAAEPSNDPKVEAKAHFRRGIEAYEAHRLSEAAAEFRMAYELSPAYKVLYNIGQVSAALGDAVAAVYAYEKYLEQGGNEIPVARRQAVQAELAEQQARIGSVTLKCTPDGASLQIDGKLSGTTPLGTPIRLTEGRHTLTVIAKNFDPLVRELDVVGKTHAALELNLQPVAGRPVEEPQPRLPDAATARANNTIPPQMGQVVSPPLAPTRDSAPMGNTRLIVGYSSTAAGAALIIAGGALAWVEKGKADNAQTRESGAATAKDATAWDLAHSDLQSARTLNSLGWVGAGVGAAALAGGLILISTAPKSTQGHSLMVAPWKTAQATGISAEFVW